MSEVLRNSTSRLILPTLHPDQLRCVEVMERSRYTAVRCGRRWGKTKLAVAVTAEEVAYGGMVGLFAPEYKYLIEPMAELGIVLNPIMARSNKTDGIMRCTTGGGVDFWTLESELAGRGRSYDLVIVDEAAFTKANMVRIWQNSIEPTLLDRLGRAHVFSNTNGIDPENFLWQICNDPKHGFTQFHAPTSGNPFMSKVELEKLRLRCRPLVWQQEYLAEFVDWSGIAFFEKDKLLDSDGNPVATPKHVDGVFAVIDTATKTGREHDGTSVVYWAVTVRGTKRVLHVLDWDIVKIEGALLEAWLPNVFRRLDDLSKETQAVRGIAGTFIEDKSSGMVLLQTCARKGLPAHPISSALTAIGKHERALNVSGYVHQGMVQFTEHAWNKRTEYNGVDRNHMVAQILGFRMGSKDTPTTEDDLLDGFTYGIAIGCGNAEGF